jgi:formylglycine-generating enzyme required for sulfatase activity
MRGQSEEEKRKRERDEVLRREVEEARRKREMEEALRREAEKKTAQVSQTAEMLHSFELSKGVQLDMVWIPAGSFIMGSPSSEPGRYDDEGPQTNVTLEGFWMGKYEVTQAQYKAINGTNPSLFSGSNNPVEKVSWNDAMEFCRKLSDQTGANYTLPTEAQWEYACRAGTTTAFSFGNDANQLGNYAWYNSNSNSTTHPVGQKQPNAYGLYDMHGNVWEWCLSRSKDYPYSETDGRNSLSDTSGARVLRGGSWDLLPVSCRCAFRRWINPSYRLI